MYGRVVCGCSLGQSFCVIWFHVLVSFVCVCPFLSFYFSLSCSGFGMCSREVHYVYCSVDCGCFCVVGGPLWVLVFLYVFFNFAMVVFVLSVSLFIICVTVFVFGSIVIVTVVVVLSVLVFLFVVSSLVTGIVPS